MLTAQKLQNLLEEYFNLSELEQLCFDLDFEYENISGETRRDKARNLVTFTERQGRLPQLISILQKNRPLVNWDGGPPDDLLCPYRGLAAFREEDANIFFGRSIPTQQLLEAVQTKPFTALMGASGSGKSSLVFAGLVPNLRNKEEWLIIDFRPGKEPIQALAASLLPLLESRMTETERLLEINKLSQGLKDGALSMLQIINRILLKQTNKNCLFLIIDQFEELYSQCPDTEIRHRFLDLLLDAILTGDQKIRVLLTMRADFLGQGLSYRPFADALQDNQQLIGPMNQEELRQVIKMPLIGNEIIFVDGLVDRILEDVGTKKGNLPLLEFALTALWEHQEDGLLTHNAYETVGKVEGALAAHAEAEFKKLDNQEAELARKVFVQLIQPGEIEDTRRTATRADLRDDEWQLASKLADTRLIVTGRGITNEETAEVAHEALIRGWARLQSWMEEDRTFRVWQERLRFYMEQWQGNNKNKDLLLRNPTLTEAANWLKTNKNKLSVSEINYINISITRQKRLRIRQTAIIVVVVLSLFVYAATQLAAQAAAEEAAARAAAQEELRAAQAAALAAEAEAARAAEDVREIQAALEAVQAAEVEVALAEVEVKEAVEEAEVKMRVEAAASIPVDLKLNGGLVLENSPIGTTVGNFTTVIEVSRSIDTNFVYSLVSGEGDNDYMAFAINGNELVSAVTFDYEAQSLYNIGVQIADEYGNSFFQSFSILIIDANDPPSFTSTPITIVEPTKQYVYDIRTEDVDIGSKLIISSTGKLPDWLILTDNGDGTATLIGEPENEDIGEYIISLHVIDELGVFNTQKFTIVVTDLNDRPVASVLVGLRTVPVHFFGF